jgi:hypothetical protein
VKCACVGANWSHCDSESFHAEPCSSRVGVSVTRKSVTVGLGLALVLVVVTACTSSSSGGPSKRPSGGSVTSTPSGSSTAQSQPGSTAPGDDPRGKAATAVYVAFTIASQAAEREPTDLSFATALKKYALDPALSTEGEHLFGYRNSGIAWSGRPPTSRVTVESIAAAGTYPTATLTDCPAVSASWQPYIVTTHKAVPVTYPPGAAKPPHAITAKVIYYKSHWMVRSTTTNVRTTCAPS